MFLKCLLYEAGKCIEYDSYRFEDINDYFAIEEEKDEIETDPDNEEDADDPEDSKGFPTAIIIPVLIVVLLVVLYCYYCVRAGGNSGSIASSSYASDSEVGNTSKASEKPKKGLMDKFKQNVKKNFDVKLDTDSDGAGVPPAPSALGGGYSPKKKRGLRSFFNRTPRLPKKDYLPLSAEEEDVNQFNSYQS